LHTSCSVNILFASNPKALIIKLILAGLLTYSTSNTFPFFKTVVYY